MKATSLEVRQARKFLQDHDINSHDIPPRPFAQTAKALGKSFSELLRQIAEYQLGGQGGTQTPVADAFTSKKQQETEI